MPPANGWDAHNNPLGQPFLLLMCLMRVYSLALQLCGRCLYISCIRQSRGLQKRAYHCLCILAAWHFSCMGL